MSLYRFRFEADHRRPHRTVVTVTPIALWGLLGCAGPVVDSPPETDVDFLPFDSIFLPSKQIVLEEMESEQFGGLTADSRGCIYALNLGTGRIQKHSPDGRLEWSLGSEGLGLGRFRFVTDLTVDREDNLYVLDAGLSQVFVVSPSGDPLRSFFFSAHGFSGVVLRVAPISGNIYIGAQKPPQEGKGIIYRFDNEGEFRADLYSIDERVEDFNLRVIGGASFVLDRDESLYAVQRIRPGFDKILPDGREKHFGGTPAFYVPPFAFPQQLPSDRAEVTAMLSQFTQTIDVVLFENDLVLVVYRTRSPSEYVIEVFGTDGQRLAPPIQTNERPVSTIGADREIAFLGSDSRGQRITLSTYQLVHLWER